MGLMTPLHKGLARQLGRPEGFRGKLVARKLNKVNREVMLRAVEATGLRPGQGGADLGFGGGLGLRALLDRVGPDGQVHGVEISRTMLEQARREYADEVAGGRLTLHEGDLTALPLADDSLDGLVTTNTVYFVEDVARAFAELARVVRHGGTAVVGVADPAFMHKLPFTAHGFRIRPVDELARLLHAAGFAEPRDERVGDGETAGHLLVAQRA